MCGEFVGTVLFLYFALSGAQVANSIKSSAGLTVEETGANPQQLQYIALCFGFSLAVNAWVFFRKINDRLLITNFPLTFACRNQRRLVQPRRYRRNVSHWGTALGSWHAPYRCSNTWRHDCRCFGRLHVSWSIKRRDELGRWNQHHPRPLYRNDVDRTTGIHHLHACCREAQGYIHSTRRNWSFPFRC